MVGLFYFGYSPFSLVAGAAMDRLGPRKVVPLGAAAVGIGALLFSTGIPELASLGRLLQGAGGVFALVGAIYIATNNFPASLAATLIGATQMFGMAGGSAGQFLVGPVISAGLPWNQFWIGMSISTGRVSRMAWLARKSRCIPALLSWRRSLMFSILPAARRPLWMRSGNVPVAGSTQLWFRHSTNWRATIRSGRCWLRRM